MELAYKWDKEIRDRCKKNNIDIDNCYIMFNRGGAAFFCGQQITEFTESDDGRFICLPVVDGKMEAMIGEPAYIMEWFEIRHKMTTYLSDGYMWKLTDVWALENVMW